MTCMAVEGKSERLKKFRDFDDKRVFDEVRRDLAHNEATKNFVVEFSFRAINIAFDLNHHEMEELLGRKAPAGFVRWMCVAPLRTSQSRLWRAIRFGTRCLAANARIETSGRPKTSLL